MEPGKGWCCVKFDMAVQKLQEGTEQGQSQIQLRVRFDRTGELAGETVKHGQVQHLKSLNYIKDSLHRSLENKGQMVSYTKKKITVVNY